MNPASVAFEQDDRLVALIARLAGEVDLANASQLMQSILDEANGRDVVVDLSETRYFDSAGMAALEALSGTIPLCIVAENGCIARRVVEIVGLDRLIPTFPSVAAIPTSRSSRRVTNT